MKISTEIPRSQTREERTRKSPKLSKTTRGIIAKINIKNDFEETDPLKKVNPLSLGLKFQLVVKQHDRQKSHLQNSVSNLPRTGLYQPLSPKLKSPRPSEWDINQLNEFSELPFKNITTMSYQRLPLAPLTMTLDDTDSYLTDELREIINNSVFQPSPELMEMIKEREGKAKIFLADVTTSQSPFSLFITDKTTLKKKEKSKKKAPKEVF